MALAGLQRADANDLARDFLALLVRDCDNYAVFALLAAPGMMNRSIDAHRRNRLRLRLGVDGVEAQVVVTTRANIRAL